MSELNSYFSYFINSYIIILILQLLLFCVHYFIFILFFLEMYMQVDAMHVCYLHKVDYYSQKQTIGRRQAHLLEISSLDYNLLRVDVSYMYLRTESMTRQRQREVYLWTFYTVCKNLSACNERTIDFHLVRSKTLRIQKRQKRV